MNRSLIATAILVMIAAAAALMGGSEYRASKIPGAVVPVAVAGVPLSAIACGAVALASCCAAAVVTRRAMRTALHSDPPPTISGRTVRSVSTGPGFAVTVEVDADRLADESFRAAVVTAVQSAISIPAPGGAAK